MRAEQRLWRTGDGRLVVDGDPDGAVLAYTPGDDIKPRDEALVPGDVEGDEPETGDAESKQARQPVNKARKAADNK